MEKIKILYLYADNSFDDIIDTVVSACDLDVELTAKPCSFIDTDEFRQVNYQVMILKGISFEKMRPNHISKCPFSVIEITREEQTNYNFTFVNHVLFESIPENQVRKYPEFLTRIITKNIKILLQYCSDRMKLETTLRLMKDYVLICDLKGSILETNYLPEDPDKEIKNHSIFEFIDKESAEMVKSLMKSSLLRDIDYNFELMLDRHGEKTPVMVKANLVRDGNGNPMFFLAALTDLSSEKEYSQRELFYSRIIERISEAIIALNSEGNIVLWNRGAEEIFSYSKEEVIGRDFNILFPEGEFDKEQKEEILTIVREAVDEPHRRILRRKTKNDEIVMIEVNLTPLRDEKGEYLGIVGLIRNISTIQKSFDLAEKRNEEMEHLISTFSHDLKAPLYSIENYLALLQESIKDPAEQSESLDVFNRIRSNLTSMENLIRDITDFSRAGFTSGEEKEINLNEMVDDIVNNIQWQVGRDNYRISVQKLPVVRTNHRKIYQIFENLLSNAYKFRRDGEPARVEVESSCNEEEIKIGVRDFGIGIEEKHHDKIFNLFYRTREKNVEGTGAGLAIVKRAISSFGGKIWVNSNTTEGTCFMFTLPASISIKTGEVPETKLEPPVSFNVN